MRPAGGCTPALSRSLTLVELLVVITLIGITAGSVTVALRGATGPGRLRAATWQLEQELSLARQWTTRWHAPARLQLERGSGRYRLLKDPAGQEPWRAMPDVVVADALTIGGESAHAGVLTLRFSASGASLPWAAELHAGEHQRVVWSDGISGQLSLRDGATLTDQPWQTEP